MFSSGNKKELIEHKFAFVYTYKAMRRIVLQYVLILYPQLFFLHFDLFTNKNEKYHICSDVASTH